MIDIAGSEAYVGALSKIDVAFVPITSLRSLQKTHNLIELNLISTCTSSLRGIESVGHSLESLDVVGCELTQIEPVFLTLENLRYLNLAENRIKQIKNLRW